MPVLIQYGIGAQGTGEGVVYEGLVDDGGVLYNKCIYMYKSGVICVYCICVAACVFLRETRTCNSSVFLLTNTICEYKYHIICGQNRSQQRIFCLYTSVSSLMEYVCPAPGIVCIFIYSTHIYF